jgi:hypothetical protein
MLNEINMMVQDMVVASVQGIGDARCTGMHKGSRQATGKMRQPMTLLVREHPMCADRPENVGKRPQTGMPDTGLQD